MKKILFLCLLMFIFLIAFTQKPANKNKAGLNERADLVKTMVKMADPVLTALSKNELKKRMPVESSGKGREQLRSRGRNGSPHQGRYERGDRGGNVADDESGRKFRKPQSRGRDHLGNDGPYQQRRRGWLGSRLESGLADGPARSAHGGIGLRDQRPRGETSSAFAAVQ